MTNERNGCFSVDFTSRPRYHFAGIRTTSALVSRSRKQIPFMNLLSPRQLAEAIGVSESSVKRWCDEGLIETVRTAGGHRRIAVQEALRFIRDKHHSVVEPRILAMPATDDRKARRLEGSAARFVDALLADNEVACHAIVSDLFLAGHPVSRIFDDVIAVAFWTIGDKWECHEVDVHEERRSCQIVLRVLHELRTRQISPDRELVAIGATIEGDQYSLPVTMAEIVLRSVGWDARLLGSSIPFESVIKAIKRIEPRLFWLSVSYIPDEDTFVEGFNRLFEAASKVETVLVVGGRALSSEIRAKLRYTAFCDTMRHLEECSKAFRPHSKPDPKSNVKKRKNA